MLRTRMTRPYRACPLGPVAVIAVFIFSLLCSSTAFGFGFEDVARRARGLAASAFKKPESLPKELAGLSQEHYREIRQRPERLYWKGSKLPYELGFFPAGWQFDRPVRINEVTADGVREIRLEAGDFDFGPSGVDATRLKSIPVAGFRVQFPLNNPRVKDEALSFLGATYFRALGKGQRYGLSARGVAIDTAVATGEEFPHFVEFWIERPSPSGKELTIYGLVDSPRLTGAYRFVLRPGTETAMEVKSRLFLRDKVEKLGIAPLTSMFFFGENQRGPSEDYRPEVHDSDGLSVKLSSGEWIWRPLQNPKRLLVTSFAAVNPAGFGLMQRDRDFSHYEDLGARPDLRPSAWIEPRGAWGSGSIELVQIPAPDEMNDNIVAYWVPERTPAPREPLDLEYRVLWQKDGDARPPNGWVTQTRRGRPASARTKDDGKSRDDGIVGLQVDFDGPALRNIEPGVAVETNLTVDANAKIIERATLRNDATGGWRALLRLRRVDEAKPVELRAELRGPAGILSETWSYILPPN
jgi:glucans biosynthesis protein